MDQIPQNSPPAATPAATPYVDNNLVWAILTTLFCCLPFGIVAIVKSTQVSGLLAAGQVEQAKKAAQDAKKWSIIAAASWAVLVVLYIVFVVLLGVVGAFAQ